MATESLISLRRFAAIGFIVLLLSFGLAAIAAAQTLPAPPFVVTSSATTPDHSISPKWGQTTGVAVAPTGDVLYLDVERNHLWHVPADGRAPMDLGAITDTSWRNNFGMALDSKMNLYVGGNYSINGIYKIPYDPVTKSWPLAGKITFLNGGGVVPNPPDFTQTCGQYGCYGYQPSVVLVDGNDNLVVAAMASGPAQPEIFNLPVNADGTANLAGGQLRVWGMKSRVDWAAVDKAGNIFFVEEGYNGLLMLPAGQSIIGDGSGSMETGGANGLPKSPLVRLDMPKAGGGFLLDANIKGVATDDAGNVYYGSQDASFTGGQGGIWMIPNEGTVTVPVFNPAHTVLVSPVRTLGFAVDSKRSMIWSSTIPSSWGDWNGFKDMLKVSVGWVDLGAAAVGHQGATITVFNAFNQDASVADDPNLSEVFNLLPEPSGANDFKQVGGTCGSQAVYHQNDRCTVTLAVTPSVVGKVGGALAVQQKIKTGVDNAGNPVFLTPYPIINTTMIQGLGQGGELALLASPVETVIGNAITGASQVTVDNGGTVFVAASGLHTVQAYAPNATTPDLIGKDLTAPTGVAVDNLGNVYIADSGHVVMVPYQNVNGNWTWNSAAQATVKEGLGASVTLAVNAAGYLFVADPDNARVLKIRLYYPPAQVAALTPATGLGSIAQNEIAISFSAVAGIGLDAAGNLLVSDRVNAVLVDDGVQKTVIASNIGPATALAMDPSGALYYSSDAGAFRVPVEEGGLNLTDKLALGTDVHPLAGIALDRQQNVYLSDATAANLHVVTVNGSLDFGQISLGDHPTLNSQVFNVGNSPITFTVDANGHFPNSTDSWNGFTTANFTAVGAATDGCDGVTPTALPAASTCFVSTTFNPDNGVQDVVTGQITMSGNVVNAPVILNVAGTAAALAPTTTAIAIAGTANANSAPVTVTVTAANGTPTGDVTISIDGVVAKTLVNGQMVTARGTLGADGKVSFDLKPVKAGPHTYLAAYAGDRTYGRSTNSKTPTIAKGATSISQIPIVLNPADLSARFLPYVLGLGYDNLGGASTYYYKYPVTVIAGPAELGMVPTPAGCHSGTNCGKVVLQCTNCPVEALKNVDPITGVAAFTSAVFAANPDSTVLHPVQEYVVTPVYQGDDNYLQSTGTPVTFEVMRAPSVLITRTDGSGAISVNAGASATANLTITSMFGYGTLSGFTGQVEFQCDNLPPYSSCTFEPARLTVNDTTQGHTTVTITTNVPVGSVAGNHSASRWLFATFLGFGLVGLVFGRKSGLKGGLLTVICAALIISGAVAGMTGCGTSTGANPNPAAKTPAGNYSVTVTARQVGNYNPQTSGNGQQQNWLSVPFTLNVQVH